MPLRRYLDSITTTPMDGSRVSISVPRAGVLDAARRHPGRCDATGRKVSLIGWSLGGVCARELAREMPESVRCVITLGTPFSRPAQNPPTPGASTADWRPQHRPRGRALPAARGAAGATTSVFSRSDGIVAWRGSVQHPADHNPHTENIEVVASHRYRLNPSAWWAVADRPSPKTSGARSTAGGLRGFKGPVLPRSAPLTLTFALYCLHVTMET